MYIKQIAKGIAVTLTTTGVFIVWFIRISYAVLYQRNCKDNITNILINSMESSFNKHVVLQVRWLMQCIKVDSLVLFQNKRHDTGTFLKCCACKIIEFQNIFPYHKYETNVIIIVVYLLSCFGGCGFWLFLLLSLLLLVVVVIVVVEVVVIVTLSSSSSSSSS